MPGISAHIRKIYEHQLSECNFVRSSVNSSDNDIRESRRKLHLSMLSTEKATNNIKIIFSTATGYREIRTAVWGATEKFILLKSGSRIPFESVAHASLE